MIRREARHDDLRGHRLAAGARARPALASFRGLRISPIVTISPDGGLGFSFSGGFSPADVNATIEHLLSLPAQLSAERGRRVALVFDEFQEIVKIDPHLIALMRSIVQEHTDVGTCTPAAGAT